MSYQEALQYLSHLGGMGIRLGLDRLGRVLERMGRPQDVCPAVLVAGTNGKGSVAAVITSVLTAAGLRVGLYTSPHLMNLRERIQIAGRWIEEEDFSRHVFKIRGALGDEILTYFEFITAVAFLEFRRAGVDVAVLEVGMGGRLDATNLVPNPVVSVITTIGLEHTAYLGRTLREIAGEKAGIIREGGICVTGVRQLSALQVLEEEGRRRQATVFRLGREFKVRSTDGESFSYCGRIWRERSLSCPLRGRHQIDNAAVALAALEVMAEQGFQVDGAAVRSGLASTQWEGRMETIPGTPPVILDGAHNPAAMSVLCRALRRESASGPVVFLFGVLEDKDVASMLKKMRGVASHVILTETQSERGLPLGELRKLASRVLPVPVDVCPDQRDGLRKAREIAGKQGLVCVTGSLYLVGAVKKLFPPDAEYARESPP
ncbi:MAG: bifunctional folylpolyglutamate synthase/dihydrofolate synthase [Syntrophaceae bacterium]|nr:bifunctional folylpolyglutamate synthase/dihydrofolate synthase [Syntrophaceae bacterium]